MDGPAVVGGWRTRGKRSPTGARNPCVRGGAVVGVVWRPFAHVVKTGSTLDSSTVRGAAPLAGVAPRGGGGGHLLWRETW